MFSDLVCLFICLVLSKYKNVLSFFLSDFVCCPFSVPGFLFVRIIFNKKFLVLPKLLFKFKRQELSCVRDHNGISPNASTNEHKTPFYSIMFKTTFNWLVLQIANTLNFKCNKNKTAYESRS